MKGPWLAGRPRGSWPCQAPFLIALCVTTVLAISVLTSTSVSRKIWAIWDLKNLFILKVMPRSWIGHFYKFTFRRIFKRDALHFCKVSNRLKTFVNILQVGAEWYFGTFNLDLQQFCSPLTYKNAKYLFWKSSTRLIYSPPHHECDRTFKRLS